MNWAIYFRETPPIILQHPGFGFQDTPLQAGYYFPYQVSALAHACQPQEESDAYSQDPAASQAKRFEASARLP